MIHKNEKWVRVKIKKIMHEGISGYKDVLKGNKKKGIAPFEFTHEANILRETADGGFVTDEFVPMYSKGDNEKTNTANASGNPFSANEITGIEVCHFN